MAQGWPQGSSLHLEGEPSPSHRAALLFSEVRQPGRCKCSCCRDSNLRHMWQRRRKPQTKDCCLKAAQVQVMLIISFRPQVCQPEMLDGSTCADPVNAGKYIQEFKCKGIGSSDRMLKEMRLSFPSGHSSFTFFAMVYLAVSPLLQSHDPGAHCSRSRLQLYLQARMTWKGSKLLRHLLQFVFIMVAWYTALSRVSDYKHHWSDVLAGSLIGSTCALVVVSGLFITST